MPRHKPKVNLELFHARTSKRVRVVEVDQTSSMVSWDKLGAIAGIPDIDNAYSRTIRFHEAQHVNHTPPDGRDSVWDLPSEVQNGIEDAIIHSKRFIAPSLPKSVLRDEACAAIHDMRRAKKFLSFVKQNNKNNKRGAPVDPAMWDRMCISSLRATSILHRNGLVSEKTKEIVQGILPKSMRMALDQILANAISGDSDLERLGAKMFKSLLSELGPSGKVEKPDLFSAPTMPEAMRVTFEDPIKFDPSKESGGDEEPEMPVTELSLDVDTVEAKRPMIRHRSSGANPNPFRLARASFSPITNLFRIRLMKPAGGAFLFDASGSMGVSTERLRAIAERVPAATIAYYSAAADGPTKTGGLVIYARDGKRHSGGIPNMGGGNSWDYQALKWLLKQKGRLRFVTDEQFCGGHANQAMKAASLLGQNYGKVEVYSSYQELEEALAKGEV